MCCLPGPNAAACPPSFSLQDSPWREPVDGLHDKEVRRTGMSGPLFGGERTPDRNVRPPIRGGERTPDRACPELAEGNVRLPDRRVFSRPFPDRLSGVRIRLRRRDEPEQRDLRRHADAERRAPVSGPAAY